MTKEDLLKKLYYVLKNPTAYAGKFKLFQEAKKHDSIENASIEDVEEWLKSQLAYTLHGPIRLNFNETSRGTSNRWAMADWFGGYV